MKINLMLRHKETGEASVYKDTYDWDESNAIYMYSEGNYSCDCNRGLFLRNWQGDDMKCSLHGKNLISIDAMINSETGETIYKDQD